MDGELGVCQLQLPMLYNRTAIESASLGLLVDPSLSTVHRHTTQHYITELIYTIRSELKSLQVKEMNKYEREPWDWDDVSIVCTILCCGGGADAHANGGKDWRECAYYCSLSFCTNFFFSFLPDCAQSIMMRLLTQLHREFTVHCSSFIRCQLSSVHSLLTLDEVRRAKLSKAIDWSLQQQWKVSPSVRCCWENAARLMCWTIYGLDTVHQLNHYLSLAGRERQSTLPDDFWANLWTLLFFCCCLQCLLFGDKPADLRTVCILTSRLVRPITKLISFSVLLWQICTCGLDERDTSRQTKAHFKPFVLFSLAIDGSTFEKEI